MDGQGIGIDDGRIEAVVPHADGGRRWVIGLGCERNAPPSEVIALAEHALQMLGGDADDIAFLASLDARSGEPAMVEAVRHFGVSLRVFSAETLERLTPRLIHPSDIVFAHTGCHGVAEGAALAAAGPTSTLAVAKIRSARATAAIATVATADWGNV